MVYEFDGTKYEKLRDMPAARRTGKVWRNGRTRSTGRNERPLVDWYRGGMDKPKTTSARLFVFN